MAGAFGEHLAAGVRVCVCSSMLVALLLGFLFVCMCVIVRLFLCLFGNLLIRVYLCFLGWLLVSTCACVRFVYMFVPYWHFLERCDAFFALRWSLRLPRTTWGSILPPLVEHQTRF